MCLQAQFLHYGFMNLPFNTQSKNYIVVMAEIKKMNFGVPPGLTELFDGFAGEVNGKQKWIVAAAAVLCLAELSPAERLAIYQEVAGARVGGSFDALIARARSGELRREAEARSAPAPPEETRDDSSGKLPATPNVARPPLPKIPGVTNAQKLADVPMDLRPAASRKRKGEK